MTTEEKERPIVEITREQAKRQDIWDWCYEHFNQPILSSWSVVRCLGYAETDMDCYVVVQCPHRGVYWNTGVGGYISLSRLKGQEYVRSTSGEDWDDHYRLSHQLELNGVPLAEKFTSCFQDGERESWERYSRKSKGEES